MLLAPLALLVLGFATMNGSASFPAPDALTNLWMIALGPITAVPLLLFAAGARRLSMATLGIVQYLGPSIQVVVGIWAFNEAFPMERFIGFACIWAALIVYSLDGWRVSRRAAVAPAV